MVQPLVCYCIHWKPLIKTFKGKIYDSVPKQFIEFCHDQFFVQNSPNCYINDKWWYFQLRFRIWDHHPHSLTRASILRKESQEMTHLFSLELHTKLNFHFSFFSWISRLWEKILLFFWKWFPFTYLFLTFWRQSSISPLIYNILILSIFLID